MTPGASGPLRGLRIVEIGGIGPGPFAAMLFADMGADVLRVDRSDGREVPGAGAWNPLQRGRPSVGIDLKHPDGRTLIRRLTGQADALIEGFRPGVMESLGLGPDDLLNEHPRLVYGRITGYGQDGPLSRVAGHDINYISIAGVLGALRRDGERPLAPLSLIADFGGGGMLLAFGVLCALHEARLSGQGQVVDAAMVDGAALLTSAFHGWAAAGEWDPTRPGTNLIDSGSHWYDSYETADGKFLAVGPLEPQFYVKLLEVLDLPAADFPQWDRARWPQLKQRLAERFATRTQAEWAALLEGQDVCATPVLNLHEAPQHPHNVARGTFVEIDGVVQPAPAPRFSRTPGAVRSAPSRPATDTASGLQAWGIEPAEIVGLQRSGAVAAPDLLDRASVRMTGATARGRHP